MYGIAEAAAIWDYGSQSNVQANFIDVSLDGNYIVAGGAIDWFGSDFMGNGDFYKENCYPFSYCNAN